MMKMDTQKPGLSAFFKPYKAALLKHLFEVTDNRSDDGKGSGYLWNWLEENAERIGVEKRSRAAVIFALNDFVDEGILKWKDATGKGGHHRLYSVATTPGEFERSVYTQLIAKLESIFTKGWWRLDQ